MATFAKTANLILLALQSIAASSVVVGAAVDVSTKLGGLVYVRFGRRAATAAGAGVNIRIEVSSKASGNNSWVPIAIFTTAFAAVESEAISNAEAAGDTVIEVASTTNLVAGDLIFFDNATIANGDFARIKSIVANVSVTLEEGLTNAQAAATVILDGAEIYNAVAIPEGAIRLRAVADGSLFTQAFAIEALYSTIDSIA